MTVDSIFPTWSTPMTNNLAEQVQSFTEYATRHSGEADSMEELLRKWRMDVERAEVLEDLRIGHEEAARGAGKPVTDAFRDIRRKVGLPE